MPYYSWPAEQFGGLDLLNDPDEVGWGGAIDLLNVEFDRFGRVRSRDGYTKFTSVSAASRYGVLSLVSGNTQILAGRQSSGASGAVDLISSAGAVAATSTVTAPMTGPAALVGTPTSSVTYFPTPSGTPGTIQKLVGTTFSNPAGMPSANYVAVTPLDNRLVAANTGSTGGPAGAASSNSHVWFSNPGAPETWGANNFVQLNPGDGEPITGMAVWRELLFVFKQTKFYVFIGTSTDATGQPIFNYRTVNTGSGATASASSTTPLVPAPMIAAEDALYFANGKGIWKTTGGPPLLVSQSLNPMFKVGQIPQFYTGPDFTTAAISSLAVLQNRLYAVCPEVGVAVLDFASGAWSIWDIKAETVLAVPRVAPSPGTFENSLYFSYGSGTFDLGQMSAQSPVTTDAGTAITSRYQSGYNKFSYKSHFRYIGFGEEKTVRQTQLYGQGTPTLTWFRDFQTTAMPGSGNAVTLGTAPATGRGMDRAAARGEALSFKFSGTSPWQIDSLEAFIRGERPAGEET